MQKDEFRNWLNEQDYNKNNINNIIANCSTVEMYEGNLDEIFNNGMFSQLMDRLTYTAQNQRLGDAAKHKVPISGNVYNCTATYKSAVQRYYKFLTSSAVATSCSSVKLPTMVAPKVSKTKRNTIWPEWEKCSDDVIYRLACDVIPYIKFLSPKVIEDVAKVNENNKNNILDTLTACGIVCPEKYLWEGSPCAYPGVRRAVGKNEVKKKAIGDPGFKENASEQNTALYLDDNDMPKQIWSFIMRGTYFSKEGPNGYSLAHLMDHKMSDNRMFDSTVTNKNNKTTTIIGEFKTTNPKITAPLYGLFSSPANAVFVPNTLMRPTDFNTNLRKLLFQKAFDLYRNYCNLVPNGVVLVPPSDSRFDINNPDFKWGNPVGDGSELATNLQKFYDYRKNNFYDIKGFADMYK